MATKKRQTYEEPSEYFPKELRKKFGLGEFSEAAKAKKTVKKEAPKKAKKK